MMSKHSADVGTDLEGGQSLASTTAVLCWKMWTGSRAPVADDDECRGWK